MRIAIISDIHSNLEALQTAFGIIDDLKPDTVICLGDIVGYGPNPTECLDIIRSKCSVVIKGNHDEAVTVESEAEKFNPYAVEAVKWTREQLDSGHRDYLSGLPYMHEIDDMLFVHGSPAIPENWDYIFTAYDAQSHFPTFTQSVCFIGHTHIPGIYTENGSYGAFNRDTRYIINVGSVGQPRDGNPRLSFGLFDTERWDYQNIRCEYDARVTASKIQQAGLPGFLADRLILGR